MTAGRLVEIVYFKVNLRLSDVALESHASLGTWR